MKKTSKYHAKKVTVGDETFDSLKECERWHELQRTQMKGEIKGLCRQVRYNLIPTQREPDIVGPKGKHRPGRVIERGVDYVADFVYYKGGKIIVEDVKGYKTPEYIIKRKLMLYKFGIRILET